MVSGCSGATLANVILLAFVVIATCAFSTGTTEKSQRGICKKHVVYKDQCTVQCVCINNKYICSAVKCRHSPSSCRDGRPPKIVSCCPVCQVYEKGTQYSVLTRYKSKARTYKAKFCPSKQDCVMHLDKSVLESCRIRLEFPKQCGCKRIACLSTDTAQCGQKVSKDLVDSSYHWWTPHGACTICVCLQEGQQLCGVRESSKCKGALLDLDERAGCVLGNTSVRLAPGGVVKVSQDLCMWCSCSPRCKLHPLVNCVRNPVHQVPRPNDNKDHKLAAVILLVSFVVSAVALIVACGVFCLHYFRARRKHKSKSGNQSEEKESLSSHYKCDEKSVMINGNESCSCSLVDDELRVNNNNNNTPQLQVL